MTTADEEMDVSVREVTATGIDALNLATVLLQRARRVDPVAGLWEAADVQWWWRKPRLSDEIEKLFWIDDEGPVAGVLMTSWTDDDWQCDPIVLPGASSVEPGVVWNRAIEHATRYSKNGFEIPVEDDDLVFRELVQQSGLIADHRDSTAWMDGVERPAVLAPPEGFVLFDRTQRRDAPHHMRLRNGDGVAQRLSQCSLYDPALDLVLETVDGRLAGNSLYWFDPTTKVGLVEPVGVEEEFWRRGLARAMLATGIDRLFKRGASRVKISYETDAAAALYHGVGFRKTSTTTWHKSAIK